MKPAPFAYCAPTELEAALHTLAQHGPEARILAGGQSLLPLMHMRLARPQVIVDINRLAALEHPEGRMESRGACCRWCRFPETLAGLLPDRWQGRGSSPEGQACLPVRSQIRERCKASSS